MLLVAVSLYFLCACLIGWVLLFPAGRERASHACVSAGQRLARGWRKLARQPARAGGAVRGTGSRAARWLRRHYWLVLGGLLLVTVPPLLAVLGGGHARLSGYDDAPRVVNTQVADLLDGEHLVPPPPLPPLAFMTAEVQEARPLIATASRDWASLRPEFEQRLLLAFRIMKERHGYDMVLLEGYRSPQRQDELAALGSNVTNARAFQSWHQYGLAADSAFVRAGRIVISERDPWAMEGYRRFGEVAESVGLTWGGRWKMMDFGHVELPLAGVKNKH